MRAVPVLLGLLISLVLISPIPPLPPRVKASRLVEHPPIVILDNSDLTRRTALSAVAAHPTTHTL